MDLDVLKVRDSLKREGVGLETSQIHLRTTPLSVAFTKENAAARSRRPANAMANSLGDDRHRRARCDDDGRARGDGARRDDAGEARGVVSIW